MLTPVPYVWEQHSSLGHLLTAFNLFLHLLYAWKSIHSFTGYVWAHVSPVLQAALHEPAMCMPALSYMEELGIGNTGMAQVRGCQEATQYLPGPSKAQLKATHPLCLDNGTLAASCLFVSLQLYNVKDRRTSPFTHLCLVGTCPAKHKLLFRGGVKQL